MFTDSALSKVQKFRDFGEKEVIFELLEDQKQLKTDIFEMYENFMDEMNDFELEAAKNLSSMVESIELKKNETLIREFIESAKLEYEITGSLAPDETFNTKKAVRGDNLLGNDYKLLNVGSSDFATPAPEPKSMKTIPSNTTNGPKKAELKPGKSMMGPAFGEQSLKLDLKEQVPGALSSTQQNGYFAAYQTNSKQVVTEGGTEKPFGSELPTNGGLNGPLIGGNKPQISPLNMGASNYFSVPSSQGLPTPSSRNPGLFGAPSMMNNQNMSSFLSPSDEPNGCPSAARFLQ